MTISEPLLPPPAASGSQRHTKASLFYGAHEYLRELARKYELDPEIAALTGALPDADLAGEKRAPTAPSAASDGGKMLTVDLSEDHRSKKTRRAFPQPNKPDPMPAELAFFFTKISPEEMLYMWGFYTRLFLGQCGITVLYSVMLAAGLNWYLSTAVFGLPMFLMGIQNVYILHDVLHGATFPPYEWMRFITHCWADFFSLTWEDLVLEHQRHHASTVDLLLHGEFGWDPASWLYVLQEWTDKWYGWLTVPLVPVWHFLGANDSGGLFAVLWYFNFPDGASAGKCNKDFWRKWFPRRLAHTAFVAGLWTCVWLLGTWPLGRPLSEGWRFLLPVAFFARLGFTVAWVIFTNFNHSHWWNEFLATDPDRTWPLLHSTMALLVGGRHRWNEMLFHDVHHAFPNAVGAMSQRGRFHGWKKVHDAAVEVLHRGLWEPSGDAETVMQQHQRKRSQLIRSRQTN